MTIRFTTWGGALYVERPSRSGPSSDDDKSDVRPVAPRVSLVDRQDPRGDA